MQAVAVAEAGGQAARQRVAPEEADAADAARPAKRPRLVLPAPSACAGQAQRRGVCGRRQKGEPKGFLVCQRLPVCQGLMITEAQNGLLQAAVTSPQGCSSGAESIHILHKAVTSAAEVQLAARPMDSCSTAICNTQSSLAIGVTAGHQHKADKDADLVAGAMDIAGLTRRAADSAVLAGRVERQLTTDQWRFGTARSSTPPAALKPTLPDAWEPAAFAASGTTVISTAGRCASLSDDSILWRLPKRVQDLPHLAAARLQISHRPGAVTKCTLLMPSGADIVIRLAAHERHNISIAGWAAAAAELKAEADMVLNLRVEHLQPLRLRISIGQPQHSPQQQAPGTPGQQAEREKAARQQPAGQQAARRFVPRQQPSRPPASPSVRSSLARPPPAAKQKLSPESQPAKAPEGLLFPKQFAAFAAPGTTTVSATQFAAVLSDNTVLWRMSQRCDALPCQAARLWQVDPRREVVTHCSVLTPSGAEFAVSFRPRGNITNIIGWVAVAEELGAVYNTILSLRAEQLRPLRLRVNIAQAQSGRKQRETQPPAAAAAADDLPSFSEGPSADDQPQLMVSTLNASGAADVVRSMKMQIVDWCRFCGGHHWADQMVASNTAVVYHCRRTPSRKQQVPPLLQQLLPQLPPPPQARQRRSS